LRAFREQPPQNAECQKAESTGKGKGIGNANAKAKDKMEMEMIAKEG